MVAPSMPVLPKGLLGPTAIKYWPEGLVLLRLDEWRLNQLPPRLPPNQSDCVCTLVVARGGMLGSSRSGSTVCPNLKFMSASFGRS
jgi:hypothetical protein